MFAFFNATDVYNMKPIRPEVGLWSLPISGRSRGSFQCSLHRAGVGCAWQNELSNREAWETNGFSAFFLNGKEKNNIQVQVIQSDLFVP